MEYKFKEFSLPKYTNEEMLDRGKTFYEYMNRRRTVREFSPEKFDIKLIEYAVRTAGTSPSGAHKQPWRFMVVESPEIKKKIRIAAEEEEKKNYGGRMTESWLKDLEPLVRTGGNRFSR